MTYKYDVAFSFLAQDEGLATQINDLIQDRVSTFLYSKRQEEIAGRDGEVEFNRVFAEEARTVIVLYRPGWGETPWTRIEQTAIRNRAYDEGYDFVTVIPLADPPAVPKWLPKTRLWVGLARWGVTGAASTIEARVQELGGEPREESVIDKAARVERAIKLDEQRKKFLTSIDGVKASDAFFLELEEELRSQIEALNLSSPTFGLSIKSCRHQAVILGKGPALLVHWNRHYANTLDGATLDVTLWRGHPPWPGMSLYKQPKRIEQQKFEFDVGASGECRWCSTGNLTRTHTSKGLASHLLSYWIERAQKHLRG